MYVCTDCKKKFFDGKILVERHGLQNPPFERIFCCPYCGSTAVEVIKVRHCKCCGARLRADNSGDYCNRSCQKRGEKMWTAQAENRKRLNSSPMTAIMKKLADYNKEHKTNLSYGQFVALVLPQN